GGAPDPPKLFLSKLKSATEIAWSPVKSALSSYPGSPKDLPKVFFKILKSLTLMTLSLLQSPARISPISTDVAGSKSKVQSPRLKVWTLDFGLWTWNPVTWTVPELARYLGSLARQLYVPVGRP